MDRWKKLYRKVITGTISGYYKDIFLSNNEEIVLVDGKIKRAGRDQYSSINTYVNSYCNVGVTYSSSKITIWAGAEYNDGEYILIIEYTKTTIQEAE